MKVTFKFIEQTIRQDPSKILHVNRPPNDAMSEQSASTNQRKAQQARDLDCHCGTDGMQSPVVIGRKPLCETLSDLGP